MPVTLSIVMPAHNEEGLLDVAVRELVTGLRAWGQDFELLVVENGSSDGTLDLAKKLAEEIPEVRALSLPRPDYGAALKEGFLAAQGQWIVNFDVDYFDLGFLGEALNIVRAGTAAVVVGTKRGEGSVDTRPAHRRLVTATFSLLLRAGFGLGVSDTHGMKAMAAEPLRPLVRACRFGTDLFDTELVLRAERAGLTVAELPVRVEERRPSRTSIARRGARTLVGLVRLRLAVGAARRR
jgi:glycosyltransferase AglD